MDLFNENIIHIKKDGIEYLQFRKLLEYEDILQHCFTLRPLDFGSNSTYESQKELVIENYKKICDSLNLDYRNVVRPYQTHSDNIKAVDNDTSEEPSIFSKEYKEIDGLMTDKKNKILSLSYADCTPLYFFDPNKRVIANIHSGWVGTTKKIGEKAVERLVEVYGCETKDLICCIGPTIRECHFEVDEDVKEVFTKNFNDLEGLIRVTKAKYHINTVKINKRILLEAGLQENNIIDSGICTVCNYDLIYSYRGNNRAECRNTAIISLI